MDLTPLQWTLGALAALLVGFSKTGIPGVGILIVPLMAAVFGSRASIGAVLPMLLFADLFAVARYRQHTRWDKLRELIPWVLIGITLGTALLAWLGERSGARDLLGPIIGALVLVMLAVHLARQKWGDRLTPHSLFGAASTGAAAGFSTTVSNAAGPIMGIYLTAMGMEKNQFMGTFAWYFFIFNSVKVPIYAALTFLTPDKPIFTSGTLLFNLSVAPVVALGAMTGSRLLPKLDQKLFDGAILLLAAVAAVKLMLP